MDIVKVAGYVFGAVLAIFMMVALFSLPAAALVMVCWNYVAVTLLDLPTLTFWQSLCFVVLTALLLGGTRSSTK